MTAEELREEIKTLINNAPDEILESLLVYIQELLAKSDSDAIMANHINQILLEDIDLLRKIAK